MIKLSFTLLISILLFSCISTESNYSPLSKKAIISDWTIIESGSITPRHEAGVVAVNDEIYLMGGRGIKPIDIYQPADQSWRKGKPSPIEYHHFQAVPVNSSIYVLSALSGGWPNETPITHVFKYDTVSNNYTTLHEIPQERRRGGAAAALYNGKIYVVGGITNGHMSGSRAWFDRYDPQTGEWEILADAPNARDHFATAIINNKLYAVGGRQTSRAIGEDMSLTQASVDVYDFATATWSSLPTNANIPVPAAGTSTIALGNYIIVSGGESVVQKIAHNEVQAFNTLTNTWTQLAPLNLGRHGSSLVVVEGKLYTMSGSGNAGGAPELPNLEVSNIAPSVLAQNSLPASQIVEQWHPLTLNFTTPNSLSEKGLNNLFTDYKLIVTFTKGNMSKTIEGYFAADGDASNTSADAGKQWQAKFTPDSVGKWQYSAKMLSEKDIFLCDGACKGKSIAISNTQGSFEVVKSTATLPSFRSRGRVSVKDGYYYTHGNNQYWLKAGANSPENLLGYHEFDGTYRTTAQQRDGESNVGGALHTFTSHLGDWRTGDPTWQQSKGKAIIGSLNYLASTGMTAVYFLTMNINGDGKDVWPFIDHETMDRFDVSKLAQWNVLFNHMQKKGLLLHIVLQETENETLQDNGDTEYFRKLYYKELIARFAHHPGLTWNVGEENGPAKWSPIAQNDQQRLDMASYLSRKDPYQNPVLLHTHSTPHEKDEILTPVLVSDYDGLSFQVNERAQVYSEIAKWKKLSTEKGKTWAITMDEIGIWDTGAKIDADDPEHTTLRRHALWGAFLGGATGVEWYFGAHQPHNDLSSEDWRQRHNLWTITHRAVTFIQTRVPFWEMMPTPEASDTKNFYLASAPNAVFLGYSFDNNSINLNLGDTKKTYKVSWFDGLTTQQIGGSDVIDGVSGWRSIDLPNSHQGKDAIVLIEAM